MAEKLIFSGLITKGIFPSSVRDSIRKAIIGLEGKTVKVTLEIMRKQRSQKQNAYWFVMLTDYVVPIFRAEGNNWSVFDVHEYIVEQLGYEEVLILPGGEMFKRRMHTSDFDTKEWSEFIERAYAYLIEKHNIYLPSPGERAA